MSQYKKVQRAAALRYSTDSPQSAPIVVASGLGYTAQKIIDVARENNVPVYQDDSLASLLSQLDAGSQIPPELYEAIVDIYVYFLNYSLGSLGTLGAKDETAPELKPPSAVPNQEIIPEE